MALSMRWWAGWAVLFGLPVAAICILLAVPDWDHSWGTFAFHFWAVSVTTLAAAVACFLTIGLARSLRETRTLFLGLAFLSIAAIFAVHGLTTPGHILHEPHAELRVSSWLSVFAGAGFIACSALTLPEHADGWFKKNGVWLLGASALGLGFYIGLSLGSPDWLGWIPINSRTLQLTMTAATLGLLAFATFRYYQAFLFARLPSQWAMVVVLVLLMEVQMSMTWGRFWSYSWWMYHALYAGAFVALFTGWAIEVYRAGSVRVIAEGLSMRDAISQLNRGYGHQMADLVDAIEVKDLYTLGHVRRVAGYAVMIGKEFGLSAVDLRALAMAAQMHDVGKIGVPDRILTKPGPLTPEEFEAIKLHVDRGYEIAMKVPSLRPMADIIRHHHERFDGSGYPDGLERNNIPLHARIVAVADAFDAMTSGRVYQPAVSDDEAIEELRRSSGSHFDPGCVAAFNVAYTKQKRVDASSAPEVRTAGQTVAI